MELVVTTAISIDEDNLIDWLHEKFPTQSLDEVLEYLATDEGDRCLTEWVSDNSNESFEEIDEYSYSELIDYIGDNF